MNNENRKDGVSDAWDLSISDADFNVVLSLTEPLYEHALHILSFLPHRDLQRRSHAEKDRLFATCRNPSRPKMSESGLWS